VDPGVDRQSRPTRSLQTVIFATSTANALIVRMENRIVEDMEGSASNVVRSEP
jgi:hypothetical protein